MDDPEARFYFGCLSAKIEDPENALEALGYAIDRGYLGHRALMSDGWLDGLRSDGRFVKLVDRAREGNRAAQGAFEEERGAQILGAEG